MDFARDDRGIIFSIWDVGRLHWFANPTGIGAADPTGIGGRLEDFLRSDRFDRWGYFPIDSYGVGGRLTVQAVDTLRHYNRVLAYGGFGAEVISRSIGEAVDWIPHGINLDIFEARDRSEARMSMGFRPDDLVIGCVMSNQQRKDWGLAFATIAALRNAHPNLKFWAHVDVLRRQWDLRALAADFGLERTVLITTMGQFGDTELSFFPVDPIRAREESIHQLAELRRPHLLGQCRRPAHVGEQHRNLDLGAAGMCPHEHLAHVAVVRVLRRRTALENHADRG